MLLYLIVIGILGFLVVLAYRFIKLASNPVRNADQVRRDKRILLGIILIEAAFIIPFLWGGVDSYAAREDASRFVKVTLHKNVAQPETRLPISNRTVFLGTTSNFHFFYEECRETPQAENAPEAKAIQEQETAPKNENNQKCEQGRPFIIPTANIAALEFNPQNTNEDGGKPPVGLSHVVGAIATINENNKKNTRKITREIKNLNQSVGANPHIVNAINTLNQTVGSLRPVVVFDPDLGKIVTAINTGTTEITEAVETIKPKIEINPDLSGITNAIGTNTTEITAAINGLNISCGDQNQVQNQCTLGWEKRATISFFPKEDHELSGIGEGLKKLIEHMRARFTEDRTLRQLIVIGWANEKQFRWKAAHYYNLNDSSLVEARTRWVLDELKASFPEQKEKIEQATILLIPGSRDADSVEVWACWTPKPTSEQASLPADK